MDVGGPWMRRLGKRDPFRQFEALLLDYVGFRGKWYGVWSDMRIFGNAQEDLNRDADPDDDAIDPLLAHAADDGQPSADPAAEAEAEERDAPESRPVGVAAARIRIKDRRGNCVSQMKYRASLHQRKVPLHI